jgi:hypothetical protein
VGARRAFQLSAFLFSADAVALPASRFSCSLARSAFQLSAFQHFSFSFQRGRRRYPLRAFPVPLRAAPFSFQLFSISAFLFSLGLHVA